MGGLDTNGYYALGIPCYFLVMALEIYLTRRRGLEVYRFADTIGNFSGGMGEIVIGLFLGPALFILYCFGYENFALIHWPEGSIIPWILAFFVSDLCYWCYHYAGHHIAALWAIHGIHHQSEQFNISVALRHPWFSDSYSAIFYIPLPLLGVEPVQFFVAISIISFYALTVHSHSFNRPAFYILTTPATHIAHHCKNPNYCGKNLGAMFTIWDRLFGTYVEIDPKDPPQIGTVFGYETHDGVRSQWVFFRDILHNARHTKQWKNKFKSFFSYPGWRPEDVAPLPHPHARGDEQIIGRLKAYVGIQFTLPILLIFTLWVLPDFPFALKIWASVLILWSLSTLGGFLDGRSSSFVGELLRLIFSAILGAWILVNSNYSWMGYGLLIFASIGLFWLLFYRKPIQENLNETTDLSWAKN